MSKEDADRIIAGLDQYVKESTTSKEKARQALIAAGLITENGEPTEPYKS